MLVIKTLQNSNNYSAVLYDLTSENRKLCSVLAYAASAEITYVAIISENEWNAERIITIKNMKSRSENIIHID